jgi:hypothetical protein
MKNEAEENWEDVGSDEDAQELFNHKPKTPYDGIKKLWSEVLFQAAEYATGKVTNDHDCGGKKEVRERTVRSCVEFLCGKGNFNLACEAADVDARSVRRLGLKCKSGLVRA